MVSMVRLVMDKEKFCHLIRSRGFVLSSLVSLVSGVFSGLLYYYDSTQGGQFIKKLVPSEVVFNVFITFVALVLGFRTAHALTRYTDAAMHLHKLSACWVGTASTLFAFCRTSKAETESVDQFQQTLIRLISMANALSLETLQGPQELWSQGKFRFELLGLSQVDDETQKAIFQSEHRVEFVLQLLQQLCVDGMENGVLAVPAPILTRSFQEMGRALLTCHEAKKLAMVPMPYAYILITATLLVSEAFCMPFMMALYTQGWWSSFFFTMAGTFFLWATNCMNESLDNPFTIESNALNPCAAQKDLNKQLVQLLAQRSLPTARTVLTSSMLLEATGPKARIRTTLNSWSNATRVSIESVANEGRNVDQADQNYNTIEVGIDVRHVGGSVIEYGVDGAEKVLSDNAAQPPLVRLRSADPSHARALPGGAAGAPERGAEAGPAAELGPLSAPWPETPPPPALASAAAPTSAPPPGRPPGARSAMLPGSAPPAPPPPPRAGAEPEQGEAAPSCRARHAREDAHAPPPAARGAPSPAARGAAGRAPPPPAARRGGGAEDALDGGAADGAAGAAEAGRAPTGAAGAAGAAQAAAGAAGATGAVRAPAPSFGSVWSRGPWA